MQYVPAISEADGMSCVVSALITRDAVKFARENVDNLTFALVAPLDAYNCEIAFHLEMFVESFGDNTLVDCSNDLLLHLTIFDDEKSGNAADVKTRRR